MGVEVDESCGVCGGDRRIGNSFGLTTTCPSCHGSGRRAEVTGFHDVTKTKASHLRAPVVKGQPAKPQWPETLEGGRLAVQVRDSPGCATDLRARLIREIVDYEGSHGRCTETFVKKIRKQLRP
jgi:hypothetical protein